MRFNKDKLFTWEKREMGSDEVLHCFGGNGEETGDGALVLHCFGISRIVLGDSPLSERGRDRRTVVVCGDE